MTSKSETRTAGIRELCRIERDVSNACYAGRRVESDVGELRQKPLDACSSIGENWGSHDLPRSEQTKSISTLVCENEERSWNDPL